MATTASTYTAVHQMACSVARLIRDGESVICGIGLPLIAVSLASKCYAPNVTILFEGGTIGMKSRRIPWSVSDSATSDFAICCVELWRVFGDIQAGYIDLGIIGGAQIDRFGNLNTTVIFGKEGTYLSPKVRMPGSGGGNDIASSCNRTVIMMRLGKGKFVKRIDYITSPGYLKGGSSRRETGLVGGGPEAVVTDKGIFRFREDTHEMYLAEISQSATVEEIRGLVGWDLAVSGELKQMEPPSQREMEILESLDPLGFFIGGKEEADLGNFEQYYKAMAMAV